jgi:hypothetical protein
METKTSILCFAAFDITDQALADEKQLLSMVEAILAEDERSATASVDGDAGVSLPT